MADNNNTTLILLGLAVAGYVVYKRKQTPPTTGAVNPNGVPVYSSTTPVPTNPNGSVLTNANTTLKELSNVLTTGKDLFGSIFPPKLPPVVEPMDPRTVSILKP